MPSPWRHPTTGTYYLRLIVPTDLRGKAKGEAITIMVAGKERRATIGTHVKVTLDTKNPAEAKARLAAALGDVEAFWQSLRDGPITLGRTRRLALAGEIHLALVHQYADDPGSASRWKEHAEVWDSIIDTENAEIRRSLLEMVAGDIAAAALAKRGWRITDESRGELLDAVATAYRDASLDIRDMALQDYRLSRYPVLDDAGQLRPGAAPAKMSEPQPEISFKSIIDEEHKARNRGKDAKGANEKTFQKFRREVRSFTDFRESENALTVTHDEISDWIAQLQDEGELSNKTIASAMTNVRTVWRWGQKRHRKQFPNEDPFQHVERPSWREVPSDERTFTLAEAKKILEAARRHSEPEMRWLPFLCSLSGARINEVAKLRGSDFFKIFGRDFYKITVSGGRSLKTENSERRIPIHQSLIDDGFLEFVRSKGDGPLFIIDAGKKVWRWVRKTLKITRENVGPNHGWRHLFEDMLTNSGVTDDARAYLTGRSTGTSRDFYGRSEASLPGLAAEMDKVPNLLNWNPAGKPAEDPSGRQ